MITKETATDIALCHREIEVSEKLLKQIPEAIEKEQQPDIRDAFGRRQNGLQLGVPSGNNGQRLFNVHWDLAESIIKAHIEKQRLELMALCEKAKRESA